MDNAGRDQKGSALVLAMIIVVILAGMTVFLLEDAMSKMQQSTAAVESGKSFNLAEGAIDLAIANLNSGGDGCLGTTGWDPDDDDADLDGVPDLAENGVVPQQMGRWEYWVYTYTDPNEDWALDGIDNDADGLIDEADQDEWEKGYRRVCAVARVQEDTRYGTENVLRVIVEPDPSFLFRMGLFGKDSLDVGGNPKADSYDSEIGTGIYGDQATHLADLDGDGVGETVCVRENGDIGTNCDAGLNGTAIDIVGKVTYGPDEFDDPTDPENGAADTMTVRGNSKYIAAERLDEEMELDSVAYNPPVASSGVLNTSTTLTGGKYHYDSMNYEGHGGTDYALKIDGDVELYIDGEISMTGRDDKIEIISGSLTLYHGGGTIKLAGQGVVNGTNLPPKFILKSATNGTVTVAGGSAFYGAVYAPDADVKITGNSGTYGAFVGRTMDFYGNADFHYDEALGRIPNGASTYKVKSWERLE